MWEAGILFVREWTLSPTTAYNPPMNDRPYRSLFGQGFSLLLFVAALGFSFWNDPSRKPVSLRAGNDLFKIRRIDLTVDPADFRSLFAQPPDSLRTWKPGVLRHSQGDGHPIEIRGRGGHAWHWDQRKPSLRIRFRDSSDIDGRAVFDLVNPDDATMLANPLGDEIAHQMGLLAASPRFATVSLNGGLLGLYHLTDRFDGAFLRRRGFDEGPLWEGNSWRPTLWDSIAEWNLLDPEAPQIDAGKAALQDLLAAISAVSPTERVRRVASALDREAYLRWLAFQTLVGSIHTDDRHNHLFRFDLPSRRLVPVVIDSAGFGALTRAAGKITGDEAVLPLNEPLTPLSDLLLRDPIALHRRNRHLWQALQTIASPAILHDLAGRGITAIREEVRRDVHRGVLMTVSEIGYPFRLPFSFAAFGSASIELHRWIDERARFIENHLSDTRCILYKVSENSATDLIIEVSGNAAIEWPLGKDLALFAFDGNLDGVISPAERIATTPGPIGALASNGILTGFPGIRADPDARPPWVMLEQRRLKYSLVPASQAYLIGMPPDQAERLLTRLCQEGRNAVTGNPIRLEAPHTVYPIERLYKNADGIHPLELPTELVTPPGS